VTVDANLDIFSAGRQALALARAAFAGGGCYFPANTMPAGPVRVPYTCGEPEADRQQRLASLTGKTTENTEDTEKGKVRIRNPETPSPPASVPSSSPVPSVVIPVAGPPAVTGIVPTPVGEPQGLDTIAFFAACRQACPAAHVVADLDVLGHKLGQLCLSFGADALMGAIVERRELRLGARAGSRELTRDEAAAMLWAAGLDPCERLPDGKVPPR
jgi:hypothetical protein